MSEEKDRVDGTADETKAETKSSEDRKSTRLNSSH